MPQPRRRQPNPIQTAVEDWTAAVGAPDGSDAPAWREALVGSAPKRFSVYAPMAPRRKLRRRRVASRDAAALAALWSRVLGALSRAAAALLTHLAVNDGIPPRGADGGANVRRSSGRLRVLAGDFGPARPLAEPPSDADLGRALWVSTRQNGIRQTWAPRWTMFSRGNVKEKARLLGLARRAAPGADAWAVDLYAGIGYFAFCYAARGLRVLCWEINAWSVEGLRRGARANGWTVRVVRGSDLARPLADLVAGGERIVVLLESNEAAPARIRGLHAAGLAADIRHVNCGLLPTSEPAWAAAWDMTRASSEAWLHLHENVGAGPSSWSRRTRRASGTASSTCTLQHLAVHSLLSKAAASVPPAELVRDVGLDNGLLLQRLELLLGPLQFLVLLEVLDVLGVRQVLEPRVVVVVLFPVVDLVLVLVVAVVARPGAHVRQRVALGHKGGPFGARHGVVGVLAQQAHDVGDHLGAALGRDVLVGRVHEAVEARHLISAPDAVAVEVVQREDRVGVPARHVVLLCGASAWASRRGARETCRPCAWSTSRRLRPPAAAGRGRRARRRRRRGPGARGGMRAWSSVCKLGLEQRTGQGSGADRLRRQNLGNFPCRHWHVNTSQHRHPAPRRDQPPNPAPEPTVAMSRQLELALLSLMPAHGPELPPSLAELAGSLLAQSRHRASALKADEEIARQYACANIACDRLKTTLDLPPIEPRPPIPPWIYKRLYTHLDNILPNASSTPRPSRIRAPSSKQRELGSSPASKSRPLPSRATPSKESSLSQFRTPSRAGAAARTRSAANGDASGSTGGLRPWIQPVIRYLCAETGNRELAPTVLAGVELILTPRGQRTDDSWANEHAADLVAAIYFFVVMRVRAITSGAAIDREGYVPLRKEILGLLSRARGDVVIKHVDQEDAWDGWKDLKSREFDAAVARVNDGDWLSGDWYQGIAHVVDPTRGDQDDEADAAGQRGQQAPGAQAPVRRADTMLQDRYDLLSEARRADYQEWKATMLSRIARASHCAQ